MTSLGEAEALLVRQVRAGDADAWNDLIARYEGRLLAFAEARLGHRQSSEDVVQETFIGFLRSLPNFDGRRCLEGYLFSICAHKLTDHLRREGRRPALPLSSAGMSGSAEPAGRARRASTLVRSAERQRLEEEALVAALREMIDQWRQRGELLKIQCAELLFVRGRANKDVAHQVGISEQQVANQKFEFLSRLRKAIRDQGLSQEVFPELGR
jgi:RNA polymerase sigma-70 factor (ECF subfamily)